MSRARIYDAMLEAHLARYRQMAFVGGPRQVGKTTTCRSLATHYMNWDSPEDQAVLAKGGSSLAERLQLAVAKPTAPVVVFDEIHKFARWKHMLKGFFDLHGTHCRIVITGSSRLDVYRRGGDSLMGRYFLYRMHPFSVAELIDTALPPSGLTRPAMPLAEELWQALELHGGFPEPFLTQDLAFTRRWRSLRLTQLTKEDIREVSRVQELSLIEVFTRILAERSACQLTYASLAQEVGVNSHTAKEWVNLLEAMHFGFTVKPWSAGVSNSLRKEPKWFLRDWSGIVDPGARTETFAACHLLKAVEGWTDLGMGDFTLNYLRTRQKQEVDFLIARDGKPWCLIEVKRSDTAISKTLVAMAALLKVPHAVQAVFELPFESIDCFALERPMVVPARTFFSQLL